MQDGVVKQMSEHIYRTGNRDTHVMGGHVYIYIYVYLYLYLYLYLYIYIIDVCVCMSIYIYIERERERKHPIILSLLQTLLRMRRLSMNRFTETYTLDPKLYNPKARYQNKRMRPPWLLLRSVSGLGHGPRTKQNPSEFHDQQCPV